MRLGVVFPQTEIGNDPVVIRDFAQAAEALGFHHLVAYDHVLSASTENRPGWLGYDMDDPFHEPFVLFGYLAGCTKKIELATGVIILPQRQTALVARQAAEVDLLSGGRLRLGVGLGWNSVEYEALGVDFHTRGARITEQVKVMRVLWTQEVVTFRGRWHTIVEAGLNPLPVQRPIPVWMGGASDAALRRTARIADGWFFGGGLPNPYTRGPAKKPAELVERLRHHLGEAGRDPSSFGIEGRIVAGKDKPEDWRRSSKEWQALGVTHLSFSTMGAGLATPDDHIEAVRKFRDVVRG